MIETPDYLRNDEAARGAKKRLEGVDENDVGKNIDIQADFVRIAGKITQTTRGSFSVEESDGTETIIFHDDDIIGPDKVPRDMSFGYEKRRDDQLIEPLKRSGNLTDVDIST